MFNAITNYTVWNLYETCIVVNWKSLSDVRRRKWRQWRRLTATILTAMPSIGKFWFHIYIPGTHNNRKIMIRIVLFRLCLCFFIWIISDIKYLLQEGSLSRILTFPIEFMVTNNSMVHNDITRNWSFWIWHQDAFSYQCDNHKMQLCHHFLHQSRSLYFVSLIFNYY